MMPSSAGLDTLLDRLVEVTESLRDSARTFAAGQAADLIASRQRLTSSLQSALREQPLTRDQHQKLERVIELGADARQTLLIKRETSRLELREKLAGRQLSKSFKPYRSKKLGGLNIKL